MHGRSAQGGDGNLSCIYKSNINPPPPKSVIVLFVELVDMGGTALIVSVFLLPFYEIMCPDLAVLICFGKSCALRNFCPHIFLPHQTGNVVRARNEQICFHGILSKIISEYLAVERSAIFCRIRHSV